LFQKMYVVRGKPAIEAQLAIALANRSGVFSGPIEYQFEGEGKTRKCTAIAILVKTKKRVEATVTWETVEKEGWNSREGSKWLTMPDLMFRYRSAMWLIRTYCPEVILGLHSRDEIEDAIDITPESNSATATIGEAIASTRTSTLAPEPKPATLPASRSDSDGKSTVKAEAKPEPKATPTQPKQQLSLPPEPAPKTESEPAAKTEGVIPADEIRKAIEEIYRLMPDKKKIPVATSKAIGYYKKLQECNYDELLKIIAYLERQR